MNFLTLMVVIALLAVIGTLIWGLGSMAHGGTYDREHSEQIMFTRVGIQAVAFALIGLALYFSFA